MSVTNIDRTYGHIDLSTGDAAPHVWRDYVLFTQLDDRPGRQEWKMSMRLPCSVDIMLSESDWEFVCRKLDTRFDGRLSVVEVMILSAKMVGLTWSDVQPQIGNVVANNLYRVYCQKRIKNGDKAWLRPSSMQQNRGGPNGSRQ